MKVHELMSGAAATCRPSTNLAAIAMMMWERDCGFIPLVDESRRLVGAITDRDICMAVATRHRRAEELTASEVATGRRYAVHSDDDLRHALEIMRRNKVRRLPVIDREERIQGVLSINDVILRTQTTPDRSDRGVPSAREVIATLQGICEHELSSRPVPTEIVVASH